MHRNLSRSFLRQILAGLKFLAGFGREMWGRQGFVEDIRDKDPG
jgi:hypothetical protein